MDITIKRLSPDMAEEYAAFFDETPHYDGVPEQTCYCVAWRDDETYEGDDHWYEPRGERRRRAVEFVRGGHIRGYLAYRGGKAIGWMNATGNCRGGVKYLREFWPIPEDRPNERVLSAMCFMIAEGARRSGVATALLERACGDAAAEGYDVVEGYAEDKPFDPAHDFRGSIGMYERLGFAKIAERGGKAVMRLGLAGYKVE